MKTINKYMTNGDIYSIALSLAQSFRENEDSFPVAVIYAIQKNIQTFTKIAEEIEQQRLVVLKKYGSSIEDGGFTVPQENIEKANNEIISLLSIEQDVRLYTFKIEELIDIKLTSAQMQALMCMIEEE